jgi:hypothetical protein
VCLLRALDSNEAATGADSAPADLAACSGVTDLLDATACELITISNPVPTCTRSATDCAALDASGCSANTDCSLEAATCVLNQGTLDTCADLNSDAVACNAHDSCTYDGTLSTCGMTTSLETCTAEAASGEAACTGAGTVAGDCDYEAEVCAHAASTETCAAHESAGDPESACTGEAGCSYDSGIRPACSFAAANSGTWTPEVWTLGSWTNTCPTGCDISYAVAPVPAEASCEPTHTGLCAALDASGCNANTDCSLEAATCVLNQGTLDTCADLNSDAVACDAHDSCTYDGTLSTCGMTTSLETCTAEAASGEAACTGAGTVAGDCDYEAEVCQPTTTAETCAAHMAAGDPESACTGEAGCTYDAIGSIVPGSPETCTDSIDEVVTDCATPYLEGSWQEPSITCPAWNAATKEGCLLTPATFTATETWTERTWDDLTEEFMAAKPLINSTFPVDPKACGANTPNTCSEAELTLGCIIGSKCVCQPGQGKDSPDAECLACPPGTYAPIAADIPCTPCERGKITTEEGQAVCNDCAAGQSSVTGSTFCEVCETNQFSLPGSQCQACPGGSETVAKGLPVCNCKEGYYFDELAARTNSRNWWEQGCSDCALLVKNSKAWANCPGGPKAVDGQSERRRLAALDEGAYPVVGPIIATPGNYLEATVCTVCPGGEDDLDEDGICSQPVEQKTCLNGFACAATGDSCFGLYATVQKEMEDLPSGPKGGAPCEATGWENTREPCPLDEDGAQIFDGCTGGQRICYNNATDWCYTMHYIALSEGVNEDDLVVIDETATADMSTSGLLSTQNVQKTYYYENEEGCDMNYIDAIYRERQKSGNGVQNFCHVGHTGDLCAKCEKKRMPNGEYVEQEKGDDGLCHHCLDHDWFVLIRNELAVCLGYYIPYNLFLRSGRPQALKSAMFASFTFFIQTVSLLGKDTGYFMGKDYMTQEGDKAMKQAVAETAETMGRIFSISLQASEEPTVEVSLETGEKLLQSQDLCPLHLDAYQQFYKGALFKSILILVGVTIWYQGIYHVFVFSRVQYYVCTFLNKISGGVLFPKIYWEWTTEVKVLYEHKQVDDRKRSEKKGAKKKREYVPKMDKVVYGPSAVMLNFHTCGILMTQTHDIEKSKEKAARVRARAQFKAVDADGGGTLDTDEMKQLLESMGLEHMAKDSGGAGTGILSLFEAIAKQIRTDRGQPDFKFNEDAEGNPLMSEDEFVHWWVNLKRTKRQKCCQGGLKAYFSKHGHTGFRPTGSVRGECVLKATDSDEHELAKLVWEREEEEHKEKHKSVQNPPPVPDAPNLHEDVKDPDREEDDVPHVWFDDDELRCTCRECGKKTSGRKDSDKAHLAHHHATHQTSQPFHKPLPDEPEHEVCTCKEPQGSTLHDFQRDIAVHAGIWVRKARCPLLLAFSVAATTRFQKQNDLLYICLRPVL